VPAKAETRPVPLFLIERYEPDTTRATAAIERVVAAASGISSADGYVECLGVIHLPADETTFLLYKAVSSDAVLRAVHRAGLVPDRIVEAVIHLSQDRRDGFAPGSLLTS
jgi:hypothetical protein